MDEHTFSLSVYCANQWGSPQNCLYPHKGTARTADELKLLVANDHVFIQFTGNRRGKDNFIQAQYAVFDCDNDHSDDPAEWISLDDIPQLFPGVRCIIYTSRSHMKRKGTKSERPRFHVVFFIDPITDVDTYTAFMKKVQALYPIFDKNALDGGRFYYGNPEAQILFFPGSMTLTQFIADEESAEAFAQLGEVIPEGSRNTSLYKAAVKHLKRWGDTPKAYQMFLDMAGRCSPPL